MNKVPTGLVPWARVQIAHAEKHLSNLKGNTQTIKDLQKNDVLVTKEGDGVRKHGASYTVECITDQGVFLKNMTSEKSEHLTWAEFLHHDWWFNSNAAARKMRSK